MNIAGGTPDAHYLEDYTDMSGIAFPRRQRISPRGEDGRSGREPLVASIDLSGIELR
ncbi:hypothetical protein [Roseomonas sp. KE2513]|uniref:hypothetical protein n=1 Tax=Roseomonas sp. KE2513 TaxID=2479202 RepID=UPI0018DFDC09|nr:hypothetical protein [Roseomonas sp. KE2513]